VSQTVQRVWTPVELIRWTDAYLSDRGFEDARLIAERLLASVLELGRLDLYLQFERPLTAEELAEYKVRLRRRTRHEPLQYIEGTAAFRKLELTVDRRVLIPRPETELLAGEVLAWAAARGDSDSLDVLDIGTGSGAIAISLRAEGRFGRVVATDISPDALAVATGNAASAGVLERIEFRAGSLYEPVTGERFDVIVSNPPYVAEGERGALAPEIAEWEPETALFAGADGLDVVRPLIARAPDYLKDGGLLAIEIGATQAFAVTELVSATRRFGQPRVGKDYAGRDRFVLAESLMPR
jgi:release factor glutamine methyltransferase